MIVANEFYHYVLNFKCEKMHFLFRDHFDRECEQDLFKNPYEAEPGGRKIERQSRRHEIFIRNNF